jgi:hypothetical protein
VPGIERQVVMRHREFLVLPPTSALSTIGPELGYRNPHWNAGLAMVTIRPVGEGPAPPKSQTHEFAVDPGVDAMAGRGYL